MSDLSPMPSRSTRTANAVNDAAEDLVARQIPAAPVRLMDELCANRTVRLVLTALCIALALISALGVRSVAEKPQTWSSTIETIDQKKTNVLALTTSCVALSAGISALPNDTGTPVAEQLSQLAGNLGIVLAVLYLEKYLLTIIGALSFGVLIPCACVLFAISIAARLRWRFARSAGVVGFKILIVAVIALAVVPASVWVTRQIDATYQTSVEQAQQERADTAEEADAKDEGASEDADSGSKNALEQLLDAAAGLVDVVADGVKTVTDDIVVQVTGLIEGVIVMIVTSCVIPVLVLVVFLWLGHTLLGIDTSRPAAYLAERYRRALPRGPSKK